MRLATVRRILVLDDSSKRQPATAIACATIWLIVVNI